MAKSPKTQQKNKNPGIIVNDGFKKLLSELQAVGINIELTQEDVYMINKTSIESVLNQTNGVVGQVVQLNNLKK